MKYRTKLRIAFVCTGIVINVLSLVTIYKISHRYLLDEFRSKVLSIATTTATLIDGDEHTQIKSVDDESSPRYTAIRSALRRVRDENRKAGAYVKYIYTLERIPGTRSNLRYVVDPEEDDSRAHVGDFFPYPGEKLLVDRAWVEEEFFTDHTGSWLSAYAPVKNSKGEMVAVIEVDVTADDVRADLRPLLWASLASLVVSVILGLCMTFWLSGRISKPLLSLQRTLEHIGRGDLTVRSDIATNDEFGEVSKTVNAMVEGLREREQVKSAFARFVSQQVMETIIESGALPTVHGDRKRITVLFSDIRNFTTVAESMKPEAVVQMLNDYFKEMVDIIFRNKGTLDKFMGDGLMAVFGAPASDEFQEEHAIQAAVEMQRELKLLRSKWQADGRPSVHIGVGVNSGFAIVGNIGSNERMEYTAIGDTVNIASRLESATKELGVDILVSEETYNAVRGSFTATRMGPIHVKGRSEPITTYAIQDAARATSATSA